jgi:hypothetical protein
MNNNKNEYHKFVDSAVMNRAREEGFGRLRVGLFLGWLGALAMFGTHMAKFDMPRWMAMGAVGAAPLAIVLLIINYIRLPNEAKASGQALMVCLLTLVGAGATIFLAAHFEVFKTITP